MLKRIGVWLAAVLAVVAVAGPALAAESRVALVIGNSAYAGLGRLSNPPGDAAKVAEALRQVGFSVTQAKDLDQSGFKKALQAFAATSRGADVAVVYYAGHGMEMDGVNYLLPVDATLATDADVGFEAVPLDMALRAVEGARRLRLVILDACRNNPMQAQ